MGTSTDHGVPIECGRTVPTWLVALDNAPTAVLFVLGAALLWPVWWPLAPAFLVYCALSVVLFWARICPHCHHYGTRACPCGYGVIAPRFFGRRSTDDFQRVFKRNLGIMFPAWFVPLAAGAYLLWQDPTPAVAWLLAAFCVVGFALIPAISKFVGCRGCEIKDQCPWMGGKSPRSEPALQRSGP